MSSDNIVSCPDSEVMIDESSKCCLGETYKYCDKQVHRIPKQTQKNRNLRLLAKTSIRVNRYLLRKQKHPRTWIRKPKTMTNNIDKVKKMIRECSKVICKNNLHEEDIANLASKLDKHTSARYQRNGYNEIIAMMLEHKLPNERYYTKTRRHHHKHHHKHHHHHHH